MTVVFRVVKTKNYTMMSNQHLKDKRLTLKAKGLMSVMLSLPENWDYTLRGLSAISKEGVDAVSEAVKELERSGYVIRNRKRDERGRLSGTEYLIYEDCHMNSQPAQDAPKPEKPKRENPRLENPVQEKPVQENPKQEKPEQKKRIHQILREKILIHQSISGKGRKMLRRFGTVCGRRSGMTALSRRITGIGWMRSSS